MTTVPPPNVALPQVPAAAAAPTIVVIPQPPPALAALPVGTIVEAVALPPPAPNAAPTAGPAPASTPVILHTAVGDLVVRLPIPLAEKAHVDLEVIRATPQQVTVRITTVDGMPTAQYLLAPSRTAAAPAVPPLPAIPVSQPQVTVGPQPLLRGMSWMPSGPTPFVQIGTISAIIMAAPPLLDAPPNAAPTPPAPAAILTTPTTPGTPPVQAPAQQAAPAAPSATLASLPVGAGSELALRIVSVQLPGAATVAAPAPALVQVPPPQIQVPTTPQVVPAPTPTSTLAPPPPQPGLTLAGPQGLPAAPPQPPALVQPAAPLATTAGTVIANVDSIPVLEIEGRQAQLNARANLPVGTRIVFEVTGTTPPRIGAPLPLPLPAAAPPLSGPVGLATGWPTLLESVSVLQRSDPVAAQQLTQAIPDGGPRSVAAAISFVQAMRSGDARQWPGDPTLRALERTGPRGAQLAATLSGEVAELASRTRESGTEWRALPIPWNAGGEIDRVALITRREGEDDADGSKGKNGGGTRFLIDLNLSRLGPVQLDGMFKKDARVFDMVMRTKEALPEDMRRDLLGLFAEANGAMGLKGGLSFQVTKKFADPLGALSSADRSGVWA